MAKLSDFSIKNTLNCKGRIVNLHKPAVMGILNITPDSFYAGSRSPLVDEALTRARQMLNEGAMFIDVGGYSTRPGASDIPPEEEMQRVIPVIEAIATQFPHALISVDTFRAAVAKKAVEAGACLVNDISGGDDDPEMFETVARLQVPYILMHKQGSVQNMQQNPQYADVVQEIILSFKPKIEKLRALGVADIVIDPGFGFGKTINHNFELLRRLKEFNIFNLPVLAGLSRKSTIYRTLGISAEEALNGTTVCNTIALINGAAILRVHDVKEAVECVKLADKVYGNA